MSRRNRWVFIHILLSFWLWDDSSKFWVYSGRRYGDMWNSIVVCNVITSIKSCSPTRKSIQLFTCIYCQNILTQDSTSEKWYFIIIVSTLMINRLDKQTQLILIWLAKISFSELSRIKIIYITLIRSIEIIDVET